MHGRAPAPLHAAQLLRSSAFLLASAGGGGECGLSSPHPAHALSNRRVRTAAAAPSSASALVLDVPSAWQRTSAGSRLALLCLLVGLDAACCISARQALLPYLNARLGGVHPNTALFALAPLAALLVAPWLGAWGGKTGVEAQRGARGGLVRAYSALTSLAPLLVRAGPNSASLLPAAFAAQPPQPA